MGVAARGEAEKPERRIGREVVAPDPVAEPRGGVSQAFRSKPPRVFVYRLVQVFGAEKGDMAVVDREGADRLFEEAFPFSS